VIDQFFWQVSPILFIISRLGEQLHWEKMGDNEFFPFSKCNAKRSVADHRCKILSSNPTIQ